MVTRIQHRKDTAANWAAANPVLAEGERGIDTTNDTERIGDGVTPYLSLPTTGGGGGGGGSTDDDTAANVKAFGAVGDGVTNDTVAIDAAQAACAAGPRRALFFPNGTYNYGGTGLYTQTIFGENRQKTWIKYTGSGTAVTPVAATINTHRVIQDLTISGVAAGSSAVGLDLDTTTSGMFHNLIVSGFTTGIRFAATMALASPRYNVFDDVAVLNCTTGVRLDGIADENRFDKFRIDQCVTGFDVVIGGRNVISSGSIENCTTGVRIQGHALNKANVVQSTRFENCTTNFQTDTGSEMTGFLGCRFIGGARVDNGKWTLDLDLSTAGFAGQQVRLLAPAAAPADSAVRNGEVALWFDATNGAPAVQFKGKQADGTVRTGTVSLMPGSGGGGGGGDSTFLNVKDFGAVGDLVADDTAELQAALTAAAGGTLRFPEGDYLISTSLNVPSNISILADPGATIHMPVKGKVSALVLAPGVSNVTVEGLELRGFWYGTDTATFATGAPISQAVWDTDYAENCGIDIRGRWYQREVLALSAAAMGALTDEHQNVVIRNCTIEGFGQSGIFADQIRNLLVSSNAIYRCGRDGVRVYGAIDAKITFNTIGDLIPAYPQGQFPNVNMYGCSATRMYGKSGYADPNLTIGRPSQDVLMQGNYVFNCSTWKGMDTHGGRRIKFLNNTVENCYILIGVDKGGNDTTHGIGIAQDITISGNTLRQSSAARFQRAGITLFGHSTTDMTEGVLVTNNSFVGVGGQDIEGAISASMVRRLVISSNQFTNSVLSAVRLQQTCYDVVVADNVIDNMRGYIYATVTAGGSGYTSFPTITPTGGGGTGLKIAAVLTGGVVTDLQVVHPGTGYTSSPTLVISGGGGTGATGTATYGKGFGVMLTTGTVSANINGNVFRNRDQADATAISLATITAGYEVKVGSDNSFVGTMTQVANAQNSTGSYGTSNPLRTVVDHGALGDGVANDTSECIAAISAALAAGEDLYWPAGTYLCTANLTNFWSVRHYGPGIISSGGNLYRITPGTADLNTLYANSGTGSNANDGFSTTRPVQTLAQVDVMLQRLAEKLLTGSWKIRMSGTTFAGNTFTKMLRPANPIVFEGDALVGGLPVTTVAYTGTGSQFGMRFEPGGWTQLRNLKFKDFVVGFNGYGALNKGGGDMYVLNCRAENCDIGFAAIDQAVMGVYGSTVTSCDSGVRVQYGSTATIGASGLATTISNCPTGVLISRNAVGHLDYSTITDSTFAGVNCDMQSRFAMIDGTIHRNAIGVLVQGGAEWTQDPDTDWGIGTANANTVNWRHQGAGHENRLHSQRTHVEWRAYVAPAQVSTNTGLNAAIVTVGSGLTFYAGHFNERAQQKLRARMFGTLVGTGSKSIQLYKVDNAGAQQVILGGVTGVTTAGEFSLEIEVWPTSNTSQMYATRLRVEGQGEVLTYGTSAAVNSHDWLFRLYANSGTATTSSVTVDMFELFITG